MATKTVWLSLMVDSDLLVRRSPKAFLIAVPPESSLAGWVFWHPSKLIRQQNGAFLDLLYTRTFKFRIFHGSEEKFLSYREMLCIMHPQVNEKKAG